MKIHLKEIRKKKKLTLEKLAGLSGLSTSGLSSIENGEKSPSFKSLEAIAKALDIKISDFIESEYL